MSCRDHNQPSPLCLTAGFDHTAWHAPRDFGKGSAHTPEYKLYIRFGTKGIGRTPTKISGSTPCDRNQRCMMVAPKWRRLIMIPTSAIHAQKPSRMCFQLSGPVRWRAGILCQLDTVALAWIKLSEKTLVPALAQWLLL